MKNITLTGGNAGGEVVEVEKNQTEIIKDGCVYRIDGSTGIFVGTE
jgi:hypothetical protein